MSARAEESKPKTNEADGATNAEVRWLSLVLVVRTQGINLLSLFRERSLSKWLESKVLRLAPRHVHIHIRARNKHRYELDIHLTFYTYANLRGTKTSNRLSQLSGCR